MLGEFSYDVQIVLDRAKDEMISLKHPYVGSEHLFLSILKNNNDIASKLNKYNITYDRFRENIIKIIGMGSNKSNICLYTPLLKKIIINALLDSKDNNDGNVTIIHLLDSLFTCGEGIALRILINMNVDIDKIYNELSINNNKYSKCNKKLFIEEIGIDLNKKALNGEIDKVYGRDNEINRVIEILCRRNKNNPMLIGDAGVGKSAIVENIARMIVNDEIEILKNKRIISLSMFSIVSGTKYRGEFEDKMQKIIKELEGNQDIILFIDEIHTLVGAGGAEGAIDASNILKPALARGKIKIIGATTISEYNKYIYKDRALDRRFQKIIINESSVLETENILFKIKNIYEEYHGVKINNNLIKDIVSLSDKYISDRKRPDKDIDILDEVCSMVSIRKNSYDDKLLEIKSKIKNTISSKNNYIINNDIGKAYEYLKLEFGYNKELDMYKNTSYCNREVSINDIAKVISNKSNVMVYDILNDKIENINEIMNNVKSEIIGQDGVINKLFNTIKRIRLGYSSGVKSFLFLGSNGVGKTKLANTFSKYLVGEDNFIRIDMSEYMDSTSINKFLGTSSGYVGYGDKNIIDEIKRKPNGVILFDGIDKASKGMINILYQILDTGKIRNGSGDYVDFNNNIIIMTSNVGFDSKSVGFCNKNRDDIISSFNDILGDTFINIIDEVLIFNRLTLNDIKCIIKNKLDILSNKYNTVIVYDYIDYIVDKSNYLECGAGRIDKIINNIVMDKIMDSKKVKE